MSNETKTAGETARVGCGAGAPRGIGGYGIIHEEYVGRETEKNCFRRHEISLDQWANMTSRETLRFWEARGVRREYTELGYMVVGISRRRWGDNAKVIDRWQVVRTGTEYIPVDRRMDDVIRGED